MKLFSYISRYFTHIFALIGFAVLPLFMVHMLVSSVAALQSNVVYTFGDPNSFTLSVNTQDAGLTSGNLFYALLYKKESGAANIESMIGNREISSENFSIDVDAGTCSGSTCVSHTVSRGIAKVTITGAQEWQKSRWFTVNSQGQITFVYEGPVETLSDITEAEEAFLLDGTVPSPTPTPIPSETPTPTPIACGVGGGDHMDLEQFANTNLVWRNGDLNRTNSEYVESDSVPYRYQVSGLLPGVHTLHLNYQFTKNGIFAFDYLTSYSASDHPDVCDGLLDSLCGSGVTPLQVAIPMDPDPSVINQMMGQFVSIYGAESGSLGVYTRDGDVTGNSIKDIVLTFTVDESHPDVVIAWGGHLASSFDHGIGMGAGSISGAPFHMSAQSLDCNGVHSQDRSIQPAAVGGYPYGSITVDKVTDPSEDEQEFTFVLRENEEVIVGSTSLSDVSEPHEFSELLPGEYALTEEQLEGWDLIDATCTSNGLPVDPGAITLHAGERVSCVFTNQKLEAGLALQITKENDATTDKKIGDTVLYTLTVTALSDTVYETSVLDLPPGGFTYNIGSWTAVSDVRGDIKDTVTTEPTYHSPGTWKLGTMVPDEVVTLTYRATITDIVEPGLYRDVAWADGLSQDNTRVLAAAMPLGYVAPVFVGTQVNVVREQQQTASVNVVNEVKNEQTSSSSMVLGDSTSTQLPSTGAQTAWITLAGLSVLFGAMSSFIGLRMLKSGVSKKKTKKNHTVAKAIFFVLAMLFFFPASVSAVEPVSIRIETPKSPTYRNDFYLNFVTLDIHSRPVVVKCFKKGPSDLSYVQFGADLTVSAGGNTNYCVVNSSIISASGTYEFYTTATVPDAESQSQVVSVDYNTSGPGTPTNYSKEQMGCGYTLRFRSADDSGKTIKIEVYRSENTSFDLNESTRVYTANVSSNTDVVYTNTVPDCGKTYYFAVRAFDLAGNGSGSIGDTVTRTTTTTTSTSTQTTTSQGTTTGGAIPVSNATVANPQNPEAGDAVDTTILDTGVLGESTESAAQDDATDSGEEILGASDAVAQTDKTRYALIAIIVLILLASIYAIYKKNNKETSEAH